MKDYFSSIFLLFFILLAQLSYGQELATIKVRLVNPLAIQHAYLLDIETKTFTSALLKDGSFKFEQKSNKQLHSMNLVLSAEPLSTYAAIDSVIKSRSTMAHPIYIEDVEFVVYSDLKTAKVVDGKYNTQFRMLSSAKGPEDFETFFKLYPDSPLSITAIYVISSLSGVLDHLKSIDVKAIFASLSESVRKSEAGLKLGKELGM